MTLAFPKPVKAEKKPRKALRRTGFIKRCSDVVKLIRDPSAEVISRQAVEPKTFKNGRGSPEEKAWFAYLHSGLFACPFTGNEEFELPHIRFMTGIGIKPPYNHVWIMDARLHRSQEAANNEKWFSSLGFPFHDPKFDPRIWAERLYETMGDPDSTLALLGDMGDYANRQFIDDIIGNRPSARTV